MRYYHLLALGLLAGVAGACHEAAPASTLPTPQATFTGALFPIVVQGRWGFIDSTGTVVIAPRFAQVQEFSEGLAPAREAGHYGYIDYTGRFVLPPAYAYASPFRGGMALVGQDSIPLLLNHAGQVVPLPATYERLAWYAGLADGAGNWVGDSPTYQSSLLDAHGRLLQPTQFARIGVLSDNRRVVAVNVPGRDKDGAPADDLTGVINAQGQLVVPYRRFDDIATFQEGVATADVYHEEDDARPFHECIIDTTGRVLAWLPRDQKFIFFHDTRFSDGVAVVDISKDGKVADDFHSTYAAAIDHHGRVLFRHPGFQRLSAFSHGRAWAEERDNQWYLIDKTGRRVFPTAVQRLQRNTFDCAPAFATGAEVVELATGQGYAALDSTGRIVRQLPPNASFHDAQQVGDLLTFYLTDTTATPASSRLGFWNWRTGLLVKPRFSQISSAGYVHGLLAVVEDRRLGYLSPAGHYVWREALQASAPLNLDYQRRSFYAVAPSLLSRYRGLGSWAVSGSLAQPIVPWQAARAAITVQVAAASAPDAYAPGISGHTLTIANASADLVVFDAQDGSIYLTLQAQSPDGQWRDIEYTPGSFCGNSYHQIFLAPGQCWQLTVPAYTGEHSTLLRAKLLVKGRFNKRQLPVYSNIFPGSINPAQFWQQQGYSPQGIMDPYVN